jgi:hypothetical protein
MDATKKSNKASYNADITTLSYHFWDISRSESEFRKLEHALNETWRLCGLLKSIIVVNRIDPCIDEFAQKNSNVDIQVENNLKPGELWSLSYDSIANMYKRFDTKFVLTIQTDGYPLREGLSDFVGKWDFIGAPQICDVWWKRLVSKVLRFCPMNGGFSLRSHECCCQAAYWWNKKYSLLGDCNLTIEDWFYTAYLPSKEKSYRKSMMFPDISTALDFSYEAIVPYRRKTKPLGFHNMKSKRILDSLGLYNRKYPVTCVIQ